LVACTDEEIGDCFDGLAYGCEVEEFSASDTECAIVCNFVTTVGYRHDLSVECFLDLLSTVERSEKCWGGGYLKAGRGAGIGDVMLYGGTGPEPL